ncbi:hypothetical protein N7478_004934 [Penicillium angulare]|uniref:uncharacterized protein n=1 Tax=Penicillium angulare TaxID=116970 RepID=UPI0025417BAC|nr:uncharacterized protein N7478_004934 [Penicillium angulare]KAJ5279562.1 hypothetical protein N7478_004934 [Penicillium angulare]
MGLSYYTCRAHRSDGIPQDYPETEEEALARLDELYTSGVPFFSKASIRSVLEQMQRPLVEGDKILVKALDGSMVEYTMRTGVVSRGFPPPDNTSDDKPQLQESLVVKEATIQYECRAGMRHQIFRVGYKRHVPIFCPISIWFLCDVRRDDGQIVNVAERISREKAASEFNEHLQSWNEKDPFKKMKQILDSTTASLDITKIVAVSLGCLTYAHSSRVSQQKQHWMIITLRDWLKEKNNSTHFPCFVQDPVYEDSDKAILAQHEVEVIDDPLAWLEMDDQSIVVSIASNVPSKEIIADVSRPAVVIWYRVTDKDYDQKGQPSLTDPCSPRVRKMMEGYDCHDFGAGECLGSDEILMYVRRPTTLCRDEVEKSE